MFIFFSFIRVMVCVYIDFFHLFIHISRYWFIMYYFLYITYDPLVFCLSHGFLDSSIAIFRLVCFMVIYFGHMSDLLWWVSGITYRLMTWKVRTKPAVCWTNAPWWSTYAEEVLDEPFMIRFGISFNGMGTVCLEFGVNSTLPILKL